jgi:hypothetical protein
MFAMDNSNFYLQPYCEIRVIIPKTSPKIPKIDIESLKRWISLAKKVSWYFMKIRVYIVHKRIHLSH